mmetsp:Transcript_3080/g.5224  ORF Transcript_3080/g.5224 Transcript_3080/m.5224 type:complete len:104 (-) Transcript_3080:45-356(-)
MSSEDEAAVELAAAKRGAVVYRVCLGGDVLFASHCIVLVNHYLDKLVHSCHLRPHREYSKRSRPGEAPGTVEAASRAKWVSAAANIQAVFEPRKPQGHIVTFE